MATFKSLAKQMDKLADAIPEKVNRVAQQTASDVLNQVTSSGVTKVDTSEALSNWRIGVGSKDSSTRPPFFNGKGGTSAAASRAEVRVSGRIKIKQKKPNQEIHVSNSVDHLDVAFIGDVDRVVALANVQTQDRLDKLKF